MDDELNLTIERIAPLDEAAMRATEQELDRKTKPRGSLGRLERLAAQYAGIRGDAAPPPLVPAVLVAAADHGYADEGVSAYPSEVTAQMVRTFAAGAAICVLAREAGARLVVVDAGVREPVNSPPCAAFASAAVPPTRPGPAMSREQALRAIAAGIGLARELAADGVTAVALGDMGIGNTTAASALHASLLGVEPVRVCGRARARRGRGPGENLRGRACARSEPTERRRSGRHRCRPRRLRDRAADRGDPGAASSGWRSSSTGSSSAPPPSSPRGWPRRPAPT